MKTTFLFIIPFLLLLIYLTLQYSQNYIPIKIPYVFIKNNNSTTMIGNKIRLLVWNIHKENNLSKFESEYKNILDMKKPDFILLQEYKYFKNKNMNVSFNYAFTPNIYQSLHNAFSGIVNFSKVKIKKFESKLSNGLEPILNTPKVSLFTAYALPNNATLLIVNIHGINFQLSNTSFENQITTIVNTIKHHKGPKVFAGDFNTWNKKRIKILFNSLKNINMTEVSFGLENKNIKTIFGNKIDYIFYSKESIRVVSSSVIANISSSDHAPIFVEMELI